MKVILLAAGLGVRLRPITNDTPKCLVPIRDRPLLDYWLELLLDQGVEEVLINTHYLPDQVERFIQKSRWCGKVTLVHEPTLIGTGGTVLANRSFFEQEPVMVAHADNLTVFRVAEFVKRFDDRPNGINLTMMTFVTDQPSSCGIVETDAEGIVMGFHEKVANPPSCIANGAVYIFDKHVVEFLGNSRSSVIDISTEVLPAFVGHINTYHNDLYLRDIGSSRSLEAAENEFPAFENAFKLIG